MDLDRLSLGMPHWQATEVLEFLETYDPNSKVLKIKKKVNHAMSLRLCHTMTSKMCDFFWEWVTYALGAMHH